MAKRRWTIMLVPHGSEPSRILEVTSSWLRLGALAVVSVVSVAILTGYGVAHVRGRTGADARAVAEREALAAELGRLNSRLGALTDTINAISQKDAKIRVLANLDPLDPAVHAAGIGGPAPARARSDDPLVEHAEQVRVDVSALIRRADLLARSFGQAAESLATHTERLAATPSIMPTQGWLTSAFSSMRAHPILHYARPHEGIDVSAPMGTPIEAPAAGRVAEAGWQAGYGNVVVIDHGFGLKTKYAHASRLLVRAGERVQRGQRVALVGSTGLSTGPHLHYEVHANGRPVDPLRYVLSGSAIVD
jgi:murein DD-endopeptidase MepM/ murein hydrolase activator NlpD